MKLTVKELSGKKMVLEVEPSLKVGELKAKVQEQNADLEAGRQKLIHKGKVLADDATVESTGVTESEFFVCMLTAKAKAPARAPAPAPAPAEAAPAPATASVATAPAPAPAAPPAVAIDPAQVESLVGMGFAEAQVRAALEATNGNPDAAYALLESGAPIAPPARPAATGGAAPSGGAAPAPGSITTLEQFRAHPQFNQLRRLVQSNPGSIDQVIQLIGQQSPQLLQVILQQQDAFIDMMNEPIDEGAAPAGAGAGAGATAGAGAGAGNPLAGLGGLGAMGGMPGMEGGPSPQQLAQMLQSMPAAQRNQMLGAIMGVAPEQAAAISDQLIQALASGGLPGMPGGGMGGMGGVPPGVQQIELTAEEAANLNQLVEMGFDRNEALQVFLACGKNVEMAASVLFEGAEGGGGGGGGGPGAGAGSGAGSGDSSSGGGDQMY